MAHQKAEGEIDVPMKPGGLLMGDSRLLHASHSNKTKKRRTVITLWYFPDFPALPEPVQASFNDDKHHAWPDNWPENAKKKIKNLRPEYNGNAVPVAWVRIPGKELI